MATTRWSIVGPRGGLPTLLLLAAARPRTALARFVAQHRARAGAARRARRRRFGPPHARRLLLRSAFRAACALARCFVLSGYAAIPGHAVLLQRRPLAARAEGA